MSGVGCRLGGIPSVDIGTGWRLSDLCGAVAVLGVEVELAVMGSVGGIFY